MWQITLKEWVIDVKIVENGTGTGSRKLKRFEKSRRGDGEGTKKEDITLEALLIHEIDVISGPKILQYEAADFVENSLTDFSLVRFINNLMWGPGKKRNKKKKRININNSYRKVRVDSKKLQHKKTTY